MENQIFEKRSFWTIFILSLVTFGLYYLYYFVRTAGQLRRAGNQIPNVWWTLFFPGLAYGLLEGYLVAQGLIKGYNSFYFLMLGLKIASYITTYYFWYHYIKSYCRTIKYNSNSSYVWNYFLTFLAASWGSLPLVYAMTYSPVKLYIASHPLVIIPLSLLLFLYGTATTYLLFQKGFNQYIASGQTLEK